MMPHTFWLGIYSSTGVSSLSKETWVQGSVTPSGYTAAFGTEINSLANGNAVLSSIPFTNPSPGDMFGQISVALGSFGATNANAPLLQFFMYPLNQDGTTYGDGQFGTSAAGPPSGNYQIDGTIPMVPSVTQAQEGSSVIFPLPFALVTFKLVVYNNTGAALASGSNTIKLQTFVRQIA